MDHSLCPPIRIRTKPRHNTRNNPCSSSFYSATRFSNQLERHSSNQRQGGWRTATPIANHPPHTGNQSTGSSTPRPSEPSDTTTRPHQLGPSLPQVMTYLTTTIRRSSSSSCAICHTRSSTNSSCGISWFPGSPQRHRSEDSKRWPWFSPPPTHLADQTIGICSPAPPSSRTNSSGTQRTRDRVVGERRHPSPTTRHIRETRAQAPAHHVRANQATRPPGPINSAPHFHR